MEDEMDLLSEPDEDEEVAKPVRRKNAYARETSQTLSGSENDGTTSTSASESLLGNGSDGEGSSGPDGSLEGATDAAEVMVVEQILANNRIDGLGRMSLNEGEKQGERKRRRGRCVEEKGVAKIRKVDGQSGDVATGADSERATVDEGGREGEDKEEEIGGGLEFEVLEGAHSSAYHCTDTIEST
jgi:hypothetical protein